MKYCVDSCQLHSEVLIFFFTFLKFCTIVKLDSLDSLDISLIKYVYDGISIGGILSR